MRGLRAHPARPHRAPGRGRRLLLGPCGGRPAPALRGRATTISPGVDLARFTERPLPGHPRILFAGSLARTAGYKGLPDLLRAVARLVPAVPDVTLDIAGSGSGAAGHRALADRLGIGRRVTFLGQLDAPGLAAAYQRARVLALPTYDDSFPTVLVEAMACGRPVVTTPVGGIPSLVADGGNGLLVRPGDGGALAAALRSVLVDDALARRLGSAGRARVARELSWERQSDRTAEVFGRAARTAARRTAGGRRSQSRSAPMARRSAPRAGLGSRRAPQAVEVLVGGPVGAQVAVGVPEEGADHRVGRGGPHHVRGDGGLPRLGDMGGRRAGGRGLPSDAVPGPPVGAPVSVIHTGSPGVP
ncbi:glycosyltransferase family 4 protein [Streptomyces zhihengii]